MKLPMTRGTREDDLRSAYLLAIGSAAAGIIITAVLYFA